MKSGMAKAAQYASVASGSSVRLIIEVRISPVSRAKKYKVETRIAARNAPLAAGRCRAGGVAGVLGGAGSVGERLLESAMKEVLNCAAQFAGIAAKKKGRIKNKGRPGWGVPESILPGND